jgi:hypothetical protein
MPQRRRQVHRLSGNHGADALQRCVGQVRKVRRAGRHADHRQRQTAGEADGNARCREIAEQAFGHADSHERQSEDNHDGFHEAEIAVM